ncbi:hypothetical protein KP509_04G031600 [Ceratopteris richardii]|uniref:Uncharacterized protein n=1 Tax=Ceratopteris richardii TaxID=49495 RepID=A0A8T2UZ71_CERRI|nr:hypothetical protein KP509_04G031600 [Ceratopteris richardii]
MCAFWTEGKQTNPSWRIDRRSIYIVSHGVMRCILERPMDVMICTQYTQGKILRSYYSDHPLRTTNIYDELHECLLVCDKYLMTTMINLSDDDDSRRRSILSRTISQTTRGLLTCTRLIFLFASTHNVLVVQLKTLLLLMLLITSVKLMIESRKL